MSGRNLLWENARNGWIGEDTDNVHNIDDREMTCMGCIGETEQYQSTIIA